MHSGLLVVFVVLASIAWFGRPGSTEALNPATTASTASTMDGQVLAAINQDRAALSLVALRLDSRLIVWSADRAAWMASHASLTHTSYGGSPCNLYSVMRVTWYQCGEAVAETTATFGASAASALYALWKASPEHEALITSTTLNYLGIGVAYRAANHTTYASILFLEGPEHNRPIPSWTSAYVSGQTIHWAWTAREPVLQSHTAAIRDYDVQIRRSGGAWQTLRSNNTDVSATFRNVARGTAWEIRIQARDTAGNLSGWLNSATLRVP